MPDKQPANITQNEFDTLLKEANRALTAKRYKEAVSTLEELLIYHPAPEIYSALALCQKNLDRNEEAKNNYEKALGINPDLLDANYNYGILLYEAGEYESAINCFNKTCELHPAFAEAWYNLGGCYRNTNRYDEALKAYGKAVELKPDYDNAIYNIGVVYFNKHQYDLALQYYNKAIAVNNGNIDAHWNKALLLLVNGDYINGWLEYESRLQRNEFKRELPYPIWKGEDLGGKHMLVYGEQGFGDNIQFVRFVKELKEKGARITYESRKELVGLLGELDFIDEVIARNTRQYKEGEFDYCVPVMSLPYILNTLLDDLPYLTNYIHVDNDLSQEWKHRIPNNDRRKIGICRAGNKTHQNDEYRSIPLETFLSAFGNTPGVDLYNLQIGIDDNTKQKLSEANVTDLTEEINDFTDTAALIQNLDMVITVDTAIAHLAGAMGKPVWVLLPVNSDWRWLRERSDSPWYPSVKLFRMNAHEEWNDVLERVRKELNTKETVDKLGDTYKAIVGLINNNRFEDALGKLTAVLNEDAAPYRAFNLMGTLYSRVGNHLKAMEYYSKAIILKGDFPEALSNMGSALAELNQLEYSLQYHQKAFTLDPRNAESCYNLAVAYERLGEYETAIEHYTKTIAIQPDHAKANFNRALLYLLQERYEEGWRGYEKWGELAESRIKRKMPSPQWDGSPFEGKTLYVFADQGLGDTIQFVRYLPLVKELGGKVIFECQESLAHLFADLNGIDELVTTAEDLAPQAQHDLHLPIVSLPAVFNKVLKQDSAYIKADDQLSAEWKEKLAGNYKVGVVWRGNPVHTNDRNRSMPLNNLQPLFDLKDIEYYLLQKENLTDDEKEILTRNDNVTHLGNELKDFSDTAAVAENLNLIVTVDTSVAHLAGAMRKEVWLMLPMVPDWRWLLGRTDTPWYDMMKLYRQHTRMDWSSVADNIKADLEEKLELNSQK